MSCAWRAAMLAVFGIIHNSKRCTIMCCGPPNLWSRSAWLPIAPRNAESIRNGSLPAADTRFRTTSLRRRGPHRFECCSKGDRTQPDLRDLLWGGFAGARPTSASMASSATTKDRLLFSMRCINSSPKDWTLALSRLHTAGQMSKNDFAIVSCELGLTDRVLQIPFLPHWRVPEFLRGCLAVCCLEQDFPIGFHTPIIPA